MITACYNSQLEMSYCMDEFAMPESRADDTLTETDSVVNFTDMEKNETAFVKVSDYLQDSKSGVSALNLELNENSGNNQKNMVEDTLDEEEQTNKGEVTVSKSKVDNCTTQNDNVMLGENDYKPVFILGGNENVEENIVIDVESVKETNLVSATVNKGEVTVSKSKVDNSCTTNDEKIITELNYMTSHAESVGSFIAITDQEIINDICDTSMNESKVFPDQEITNDVSDNSKETDVPKIFLTIEDDQPSLKRKSSGLIPLNDQSDPLHIYQKNHDDAIFHSSVTLQEKTQKRFAKFRNVLFESSLSMSPYLKYDVPYLDTEVGSSSIIRKFFPEDLYWSKYFEPVSHREKKKYVDRETDPPCKPASPWCDIEITKPHPLILTQITGSLSDKKLQVSFTIITDLLVLYQIKNYT